MLYARHSCRVDPIKHLFRENPTVVITLALMDRIPSELHREACLAESSTRMYDLVGSPRVAPLFCCFFFFNCSNLLDFLCCGRWIGPDQDVEKAFKSGLLAVSTRNYQNALINAAWQ